MPASRRGDAVSYIAPQAARSSAAGRSGRSRPARRWPSKIAQRPAGQRRQRGLGHDRAAVDGGGLAQQVLQADAQRVAADQPVLADGGDVDQRQAGGGDVGEDDLDHRGEHRGEPVVQLGVVDRRRSRRRLARGLDAGVAGLERQLGLAPSNKA